MNASELRRKLLFFGHGDVTEFLQNSPLNRYLYKQILVCREESGIDTPVVTLFNEIYFQCVRVGFDINPGDNISRRYIEEACWWLKSRKAALIVFYFVWSLLKMKRTLTFNEECFLEHLTPLLSQNNYSKEGLEEIVRDMKWNDIKVPDQFAPMVYPVVAAIPIETDVMRNPLLRFVHVYSPLFSWPCSSEYRYRPSPNAWQELTDDYSHAWIEKYVKLYNDKENRLAILERIEASMPWRLRKKHEDFFLGLRTHIESGQIVYRVIRDDETDSRHGWLKVENFGIAESLNPYTNELENVANQYKQERDEARQQCEEQKKTYEMELARLEAKYENAVKELEETTKSEVSVEGTSTELSLTVSEMAEHVKERFSKAGAEEFITMYYRLAMKHGNLDEDTCKIIDDIVPAVIERDKPLHKVDISQANQVNINPQEVVNHFEE